jgi:hypothetical protein
MSSLNRTALRATIHCLTGCSIGEVAGMVLGTLFAWANGITILVSIVLAFVFGYSLTMLPLLSSGMSLASAAKLALISDTASISVMEAVDNLVMIVVPGAMASTISFAMFWVSLFISLLLTGFAAYPLNRWLISRGRGHAVVHARHTAAHDH